MAGEFFPVEPGAGGLSSEDRELLAELRADGFVTPAELADVSAGRMVEIGPLTSGTDTLDVSEFTLTDVLYVVYDGGLCSAADYTFSVEDQTIVFDSSLLEDSVIQIFGR